MTATVTAPAGDVTAVDDAGPGGAGPPVHESSTRRTAGLLELLVERAVAQERLDLVAAARLARQRLESGSFRVAVLGEFNSGKSALVNALVDAPVCAVDDDVTSQAPVEVGFAETDLARVWSGDAQGGPAVDDVAFADAAEASTRSGTTLVRVGLPRHLLASGLVLIDTPATGGLSSATATVTASALAEAHAALFVTDASQELTAPEMDALVDATQRCGRVILVETRIDICPHWQTITHTDRAHLAARGLDVPVVAVSSALRVAALAHDDASLNVESGFPALLELIDRDLIGSAHRIRVEIAVAEGRRILRQLRAPLQAERVALAGTGDAVAAAEADLARLRKRTASWQQVLGDGVADLAAAVDADLRNGFRAVLRELEATIDEIDPDEAWPEQEPRIHRLVAETVDANLTLLRTGADELAARLGDLIGDGEPAPVGTWEAAHDDPDGDDAPGGETAGDEPRRLAYGDAPDDGGKGRVHHAFRAGYGGAMPVMVVGGMALGVLGLGALVLPLAGVAGALAGRRAIGDDRKRQVRQRRQQAKTVVRTHLDEVGHRATVEHKAAQRRVQRALRDHFSRRVAELTASGERAVAQARRAVEADAATRAQRLEIVERELVRLDVLARALGRGGAA